MHALALQLGAGVGAASESALRTVPWRRESCTGDSGSGAGSQGTGRGTSDTARAPAALRTACASGGDGGPGAGCSPRRAPCTAAPWSRRRIRCALWLAARRLSRSRCRLHSHPPPPPSPLPGLACLSCACTRLSGDVVFVARASRSRRLQDLESREISIFPSCMVQRRASRRWRPEIKKLHPQDPERPPAHRKLAESGGSVTAGRQTSRPGGVAGPGRGGQPAAVGRRRVHGGGAGAVSGVGRRGGRGGRGLHGHLHRRQSRGPPHPRVHR